MEKEHEQEHIEEHDAEQKDHPTDEPRADDSTDVDTSSEDKEMSEMSKEFDEIVSSSSSSSAATTTAPASTTSDQSTEQKIAAPEQQPREPAQEHASKGNKFNKYFLYTLVGGLVVSALISVFAVLAGEFTSTMARALGTTVSMVIHTLVLLFLLSLNKNGKSKTNDMLKNALLVITVASFATSIIAIWNVISGQIIGDLYQLYFNSFCAVLWAQLMLNVGGNLLDKPTRISSLTTVGLTALLYFQLVPTIFVESSLDLPEFYYRTIAAVAILLATSSVLTIVFNRIYTFKHPEVKSSDNPRSPTWNIIVACILLFLLGPIFFVLVGMLTWFNTSSNTRTDTSYEPKMSQSPIATIQPGTSPDPLATTQPDASSRSGSLDATQPRSSSGTPSQRYGGGTQGGMPTSPYNLAKECIKVSQQNISDSNIHVFSSINTAKRSLVTKQLLRQQYPSTHPYYAQTEFVDKNCAKIDPTSLKSGDKLYFYYTLDTNSAPQYKLRYVQKID